MADILMYHGIDTEGGPTSVSPTSFAAQMEELAASGRPVQSMDDWIASGDPAAVVITFDDALTSFADTAWPILRSHGFPAIVYVPTAHVGGAENWENGHRPARAILPWSALADLAKDGVDFGGHTRNHPNLTKLSDADCETEIAGSKADLEDALNRPARHFAPPYGASTPHVRAVIASHWQSSVGVTLNTAQASQDRFTLPRLEMLYFCDTRRWRAHLSGRGRSYFALRRGLRAVRQVVRG